MKLCTAAILLLVSALTVAAPVQVYDARILELPHGTQIVLDLSAPVRYHSFLLNHPPRLVVDLSDVRFTPFRSDLRLRSPDVNGVRAGIRAGVDLRIVLDLVKPVRSEIYTVMPTAQRGHRLVVDIYRHERQPIGTAPQRLLSVADAEPMLPVRKDFIVVIDPGHGGKDPGAIGPGKTQEKNVAMQISRRLKKLVDKEPGMRAILTRNSDKYLLLYERIEIARQHQADLFLSIHADAFTNSKANGSSVFILSTKGASSAAARWLAKQENEADLIGGGKLHVEDDALKPVVFDIYHDAILADSMRLAEKVHAQLRKVGNVHRREVERAGFAVLKSPDIPSILVETAFISNPKEEAKLRSTQHQQKLAEAMMEGIRAYFENRPPKYLLVDGEPVSTPGEPSLSAPTPAVQRAMTESTLPTPVPTLPNAQPELQLVSLETVKKEAKPPSRQTHVIKRGESLADIARHYHANLSLLRSINGLSSKQLRMPAGTLLFIPVGDSSL
jgi:N-acetylmuramoyl-L-alanine amidase